MTIGEGFGWVAVLTTAVFAVGIAACLVRGVWLHMGRSRRPF